MSIIEQIKVRPEEADQRLDKLLPARFPEQSRSYFQSLIREGMVLLNGQKVKKQIRPQIGDKIEVSFLITEEIALEAEDVPLDVLFEDEWLLVINKPAGLVVHPGPKNWHGTVANGLLYRYRDLIGDRPGIVHRLDKETSGLLLCAKSLQAQSKLMKLFADREVDKEYLAITIGKPKEGLIDAPIGRSPNNRKVMCVREDGKKAKTIFKPLAWDQQYCLVKCHLLTGRTHQIRVHLKHIGAPMLGDATYGVKKSGFDRQMLHAHALKFVHPYTGKQMEFTLPPPNDMQPTVERLLKSQ